MERMTKIGNNNSKLLDALVKAATAQSEKPEVEFDISKILKNNPKEPTLQEIFSDVVRNSGKNITRIAQFGGAGGGMSGMKPMPEPAVEEDAMFSDVGDIGEPPMEGGDELGGMPGEDTGDSEAARKVLEGLVEMVGADQVRQLADECCAGGMGDELGGDLDGMPGEEGLGDPLGGELDGAPDDMAAEMPSAMPTKAMPAPMAEPAPMPAPM